MRGLLTYYCLRSEFLAKETKINLKAGVIGCGNIARRAHFPAYRDLGIEVVGAVDSSEKRASSCARKFKIKRIFTNYNDLFKEDLDLVSICTPHSTHAQITIDAAKAGINVLVEKPMATNSQDAESMIQACKDSGVKLCVVHNYRFFPAVLEAKKRMKEGRIGRIVSMQAVGHDFIDVMYGAWRFKKWGVLEDFGPHIIDIVNFVNNSSPLEDIKVIARDYTGNMGCLNDVQAIMMFKNGTRTSIDLSWVTGTFDLYLKIFGTAGTLDVSVRDNHVREIHGYSTPLEELGSLSRKSIGIAKAVINRTYFKGSLLHHKLIIKRFVESIVKGTDPPVTGEEGRAVLAIMDSIKNHLTQARDLA